jgi:HPt (histidine-containing phosphotransfer) domain-containing protein
VAPLNARADFPIRSAVPVSAPQAACDRAQSRGLPEVAGDWSGGSISASATLAARIERARCTFVDRARSKIERAAELASELALHDASTSRLALEELQRLAHSLCGTAGSFGYERLSEIAGTLEDAIVSGHTTHQQIPDLVVEMATEFLGRVTGQQLDFA